MEMIISYFNDHLVSLYGLGWLSGGVSGFSLCWLIQYLKKGNKYAQES